MTGPGVIWTDTSGCSVGNELRVGIVKVWASVTRLFWGSRRQLLTVRTKVATVGNGEKGTNERAIVKAVESTGLGDLLDV